MNEMLCYARCLTQLATVNAVLYPVRLFVSAKDFFHHADDLTQGGIGVDGLQEVGHGVFRALAGDAQAVEGLAHTPGIASAGGFPPGGRTWRS